MKKRLEASPGQRLELYCGVEEIWGRKPEQIYLFEIIGFHPLHGQ
jgi:hypothetical protein